MQVFNDLYYMCLETKKTDIPLATEYLMFLSDECEKAIASGSLDIREIFNLHKKVLLAGAEHSFHLFLLYLEWNREPRKKFYPPRRKVLKQVVDALQELEDDKLDLLAISLPPGSGKTTLAIFYLTWLAGKHSDEPMLTGSHSNSFVRGVYDECLRILDPQGEYLWHDVFPTVQVSSTNAKDCRIDLGKRKRFETLEFTSIGTGNAGLYRASRLLYCDDLVSGIEVALSKERLDKLWETYTTDLRQRLSSNYGIGCESKHSCERCRYATHLVAPPTLAQRDFFNGMNQSFRRSDFRTDTVDLRIKLNELIYLTLSGNDECMRTMLISCADIVNGQFTREIYDNLFNDVTIEMLARKTNRSLTSFKKEFRRQFAVPPHKWFIDQRLQRAKILLMSTNLTISEIGAECSFSNISHFIKLFKLRFHDTPASMRRKSRQAM